MKIEFDPNDPQERQLVSDFLTGTSGNVVSGGGPAGAPAPAAAPAGAPAPAAAAAPAPAAAAPAPAAAAPAPAAAPTQQQFSEAVQAAVRASTPKAVMSKMAEMGFSKTSDVPPEQYANVMAALAG